MSEKQSVSGVVVRNFINHEDKNVSTVEITTGEQFCWPYAIPEGTPVKVTVEVGGKARKRKP